MKHIFYSGRQKFLIMAIIGALSCPALSQTITWTDISAQYTLSAGLKLFSGNQSQPALKAWYLEVDLSQAEIALCPYLSTVSEGKESVLNFSQHIGAIAAINGGYFGGATSYSAVIHPEQILAQNIAAVTRSGLPYPVTRSMLAISARQQLSIHWIYHFGNQLADTYYFDQPLPNAPGTPAAIPQKENGHPFTDLFLGLGGGPTLIQDGTIKITYNEEVFWESGIGFETLNPRTAVGITPEQHALLLTIDGRQSASVGVGLPELAQIMLNLNCVAAMNLDGGGSSQMAVGSQLVNRPEGGTFGRAVPTILAVIHPDSLPGSKEVKFEKIIDTQDSDCRFFGNGWFATANSGYWGDSKSMLNARGTGAAWVQYTLNLQPARYELFAWWVAANNRCTDTPFIVHHQNGVDTIRVDQVKNGSQWNKIGQFYFSADSSNRVIISNAATQGSYVVADAIRLTSNDPGLNGISLQPARPTVQNPRLAQNYPNPFNAWTQIEFILTQSEPVLLRMLNIRGEQVTTLMDQELPAGSYRIDFNAAELATGIYFYQLQTPTYTEVRKMVLLK